MNGLLHSVRIIMKLTFDKVLQKTDLNLVLMKSAVSYG